MRKIAIIKNHDSDDFDRYSDVYIQLLRSLITDFVEVDEETYQTLIKASRDGRWLKRNDFIVIEQLQVDDKFIPKTVADYVAFVEAKEAERRERIRVQEEKKIAASLRKIAKTEEDEKALLAKLLAKHQGVVVPPGDE